MQFRFNDAKTAQAAAHLLKLNGGTMPYMVLIKLLYMADRKTLVEQGQPITGDRLASMKHGPVLSQVLDFINHGPKRIPETSWFTLISEPDNYNVSLKAANPPSDELSRYELRVLGEVSDKYGKMDRWDLVDLLHSTLPEWQNPGSGMSRIEYADIMRAEDLSDEEIARRSSEAKSAYLLDSFGASP